MTNKLKAACEAHLSELENDARSGRARATQHIEALLMDMKSVLTSFRNGKPRRRQRLGPNVDTLVGEAYMTQGVAEELRQLVVSPEESTDNAQRLNDWKSYIIILDRGVRRHSSAAIEGLEFVIGDLEGMLEDLSYGKARSYRRGARPDLDMVIAHACAAQEAADKLRSLIAAFEK